MITDREVTRGLSGLPVETQTLFETLPADFQEAYLRFWQLRPDPHSAHRDTLPAFVAGLFTGLRRY